ncbi:MAG: DUF5063 domain-containing protein [Micrococcales bacterium]|nr:DUF5063 domain-containing protein [Micrococcales bacterium]MCL2668280.1 DUF5063 domain-containing protein [Micrococcales bacterium]
MTVIDDDLHGIALQMAGDARAYLTTVTEVAAGASPAATLPLLLLAVSDVLVAGSRLGAITDVVPTDRFEPDLGPDPDVDPLRDNLVNALEGVDEYTDVVDPLLGDETEQLTVSGGLVSIAQALVQGLRHYETGRVTEALWWWQFSYLSDWGTTASSVLRTLQEVLAHVRLDVDDDVAAEAEFEALQS